MSNEAAGGGGKAGRAGEASSVGQGARGSAHEWNSNLAAKKAGGAGPVRTAASSSRARAVCPCVTLFHVNLMKPNRACTRKDGLGGTYYELLLLKRWIV